MYKVVIADDEPFVIEGLKIMFDWNASGFEVADTASDGLEAYKKIIDIKPEVAIIDIRMPLLDGLELVKKLREDGYEGGVIILTAYAEVNYARESLRYGVKYFLEKPVDTEEMRAALEDFKRELDRKVRRRAFIYKNLGKSAQNGDDYREWCVMCVKLAEPAAVTELPAGVRLYENSIGVQSYSIGAEENVKEKAERFFGRILETNPEAIAAAAYCGAESDLPKCRERALDTLVRLIKPVSGRLYEETPHKNEEISAAQFSQRVAELTEHIEFGDDEAAEECLDAFFDLMTNAGEPLVCAQMLYSYMKLYANKIAVKYKIPVKPKSFDGSVMVDLSDYYSRVREICAELTKLIPVTKSDGEERMFDMVERYLREHFKEDIVIKDIAAMLYASPGYLGALFTKEMGMSIKDYIHSLRMKEAERLMRESSKTISEIAYEVGYNNYNHFYMQFERRFGTTPAEYRKKLK